MEENELPDEYKPVSMWMYVGLFFLSSVPCVGIICTIIFACGVIKNKNITNFARAQLIVIGIILAIYFLLIFLGLSTSLFAGIMERLY